MSFLLESRKFDPAAVVLDETLYHTANGYLGIRANFEEGLPDGIRSVRGTYINAFHDTHPIHHPEKLHGFPETGERILNITDVQKLDVEISGERLRMDPDRIGDFHRALDMKKGVASRSSTWTGSRGQRVRIETRRLTSFSRPGFFVMEYALTALDDVEVSLRSIIDGDVENFSDPGDPRVSGEGFRALDVRNITAAAGRIEMESRTQGTGAVLWVRADHRMTLDGTDLEPEASDVEADSGMVSWSVKLASGRRLILEKCVRFADSLRFPGGPGDSEDESPRFADLAAEQESFLEEFWNRSDISLEGDDHILAGLRFSLYHLLQSAPRDRFSGIPAKGLSGEGYEGHYFWDTEIYMLPFFLYTRPETARMLLEYRHSTLPAAREHARELGHRRGAAYPWRTIAGRECSAYYPSGSAQYHINADIAFAVGKFMQAAGDEAFPAGRGAEILFETARIWMELGGWSRGRFHICGITGPDEYTCLVDDNCYTNRMARENLSLAAAVHARLAENDPGALTELAKTMELDEGEAETWGQAAAGMFIPYDEERDMNPQNAGFLDRPAWDFDTDAGNDSPLLLRYHHMTLSRHQVCKQADTVLADMLLGPAGRMSTVKNNFDYYESITTHDSSLSYAAFSVMALRLGDAEKALEYFRENASLDLDDSHGNTRDGIHAANMGGAWMAFVQGFGGFVPAEDGPSFAPKLPASWKSLGYRIRWRGSVIAVRADHAGLALSLEDGPPLDVTAWGEKHRLETSLEIAAP